LWFWRGLRVPLVTGLESPVDPHTGKCALRGGGSLTIEGQLSVVS
jgi:hypothetical protein